MQQVTHKWQKGRRLLLPFLLLWYITHSAYAQKVNWNKMNICPWRGQKIRAELSQFLGKQLPYAVWIFVIPDPLGGKLTYMPQLRGAIKDILTTKRVHEKFVFIIDDRKRIPHSYKDSLLPFLLGKYYSYIRDQIAGLIWDTTRYLIRKYTLNIGEGLVFAILLYGDQVLFCNEVKWHLLTDIARSLGSNEFIFEPQGAALIPCNDSITDLCTYYNPNLITNKKALFSNYDPSCLQWFDLTNGTWGQGKCIDDAEALRLFCKFFAPSPQHCLSALKYFKVMRDVGRGSIVFGSFAIDSNQNIWAGGSAELFVPVELVKETHTGTDLPGYKKPAHTYTSYVFSLVTVFDSMMHVKRMIPVTADEKTWNSVWYGEAFVDPGTAGIIHDSLYITYWTHDIWFYPSLSPRRLIGTLNIRRVSKFCGFKLDADTFDACIPLGGPQNKTLSKQLVASYSSPMFVKFNNRILFSPGTGEKIYDVFTGKTIIQLSGPSYIKPFTRERVSTYLTDNNIRVNFVIYSLSSDSSYLYVLYKYKVSGEDTVIQERYSRKFIEVFDTSFNRVAIIPLDAYQAVLGKCGVKYGLMYHGGNLVAVCYEDEKDVYVIKRWLISKTRK